VRVTPSIVVVTVPWRSSIGTSAANAPETPNRPQTPAMPIRSIASHDITSDTRFGRICAQPG